MTRSKFPEPQIAFVSRQPEEGMTVEEVCRETGISKATVAAWTKKYGGLLSSEMKSLLQLEEKNARLKRIVADLPLDKDPICHPLRRAERPHIGGVCCSTARASLAGRRMHRRS